MDTLCSDQNQQDRSKKLAKTFNSLENSQPCVFAAQHPNEMLEFQPQSASPSDVLSEDDPVAGSPDQLQHDGVKTVGPEWLANNRQGLAKEKSHLLTGLHSGICILQKNSTTSALETFKLQEPVAAGVRPQVRDPGAAISSMSGAQGSTEDVRSKLGPCAHLLTSTFARQPHHCSRVIDASMSLETTSTVKADIPGNTAVVDVGYSCSADCIFSCLGHDDLSPAVCLTETGISNKNLPPQLYMTDVRASDHATVEAHESEMQQQLFNGHTLCSPTMHTEDYADTVLQVALGQQDSLSYEATSCIEDSKPLMVKKEVLEAINDPIERRVDAAKALEHKLAYAAAFPEYLQYSFPSWTPNSLPGQIAEMVLRDEWQGFLATRNFHQACPFATGAMAFVQSLDSFAVEIIPCEQSGYCTWTCFLNVPLLEALHEQQQLDTHSKSDSSGVMHLHVKASKNPTFESMNMTGTPGPEPTRHRLARATYNYSLNSSNPNAAGMHDTTVPSVPCLPPEYFYPASRPPHHLVEAAEQVVNLTRQPSLLFDKANMRQRTSDVDEWSIKAAYDSPPGLALPSVSAQLGCSTEYDIDTSPKDYQKGPAQSGLEFQSPNAKLDNLLGHNAPPPGFDPAPRENFATPMSACTLDQQSASEAGLVEHRNLTGSQHFIIHAKNAPTAAAWFNESKVPLVASSSIFQQGSEFKEASVKASSDSRNWMSEDLSNSLDDCACPQISTHSETNFAMPVETNSTVQQGLKTVSFDQHSEVATVGNDGLDGLQEVNTNCSSPLKQQAELMPSWALRQVRETVLRNSRIADPEAEVKSMVSACDKAASGNHSSGSTPTALVVSASNLLNAPGLNSPKQPHESSIVPGSEDRMYSLLPTDPVKDKRDPLNGVSPDVVKKDWQLSLSETMRKRISIAAELPATKPDGTSDEYLIHLIYASNFLQLQKTLTCHSQVALQCLVSADKSTLCMLVIMPLYPPEKIAVKRPRSKGKQLVYLVDCMNCNGNPCIKDKARIELGKMLQDMKRVIVPSTSEVLPWIQKFCYARLNNNFEIQQQCQQSGIFFELPNPSNLKAWEERPLAPCGQLKAAAHVACLPGYIMKLVDINARALSKSPKKVHLKSPSPMKIPSSTIPMVRPPSSNGSDCASSISDTRSDRSTKSCRSRQHEFPPLEDEKIGPDLSEMLPKRLLGAACKGIVDLDVLQVLKLLPVSVAEEIPRGWLLVDSTVKWIQLDIEEGRAVGKLSDGSLRKFSAYMSIIEALNLICSAAKVKRQDNPLYASLEWQPPGSLLRVAARKDRHGQIIGISYYIGHNIPTAAKPFTCILHDLIYGSTLCSTGTACSSEAVCTRQIANTQTGTCAKGLAAAVPASPSAAANSLSAPVVQASSVKQCGGCMILVGKVQMGKSTILRSMANILSDDFKLRVFVVDTRGHVGGVGPWPHASLGAAKQLGVGETSLKNKLMEEAVRQHGAQVVMLDVLDHTDPEDFKTMDRLSNLGVAVVATCDVEPCEALMSDRKHSCLWEKFPKTGSIRYIVEILDIARWHVHALDH